ncbi:hypothetical protein NQ317_009498 [Molorchus minor]|uniref:Uncharacterized protein n=1 Tax=Molorchus minor TaxID=1323400 RepID=A0ABQ9IVH3_9CUCU|nr:hypothetical protein NQ317_009498 [Molorchus minor]
MKKAAAKLKKPYAHATSGTSTARPLRVPQTEAAAVAATATVTTTAKRNTLYLACALKSTTAWKTRLRPRQRSKKRTRPDATRSVWPLAAFRCVCHSLQLAVSTASEKTLPRNIEFLIKETYNWFSHSSIRQLSYKQIYSLINNGEEPLKILKMAATRWISIEPALKRVLDQWNSLKAHFDIVRVEPILIF